MHATWKGMYERVHTEERAHMNVPVHHGEMEAVCAMLNRTLSLTHSSWQVPTCDQ